MNRHVVLPLLLVPFVLTSCVVHHRRHHQPPPASASVRARTPPPQQRETRYRHSGQQQPQHRQTHQSQSEPPAPRQAKVRAPAAPEEGDAPAPRRTKVRAPAAPEGDSSATAHHSRITLRVEPTTVKRGQKVKIHLNPPNDRVKLFFNERPIPKKVLSGGAVLEARVPANGQSGYFEVELDGQRFRSPRVTVR